MTPQLEALALRDPILERLDLIVLELLDAPAFEADQVIVMLIVMGHLVARDAVPEMPLDGQAAFLEQLQRSIDRGVADLGIDRADLGQELLDR